MNRREVVQSIGTASVVGLSGCLDAVKKTFNRNASDRDDLRRKFTVSSQPSIPENDTIHINAQIINSEISSDTPGRIAVRTTNHGERQTISIGKQRCGLFNRDKGGSDDPPGLWLYPPTESKLPERAGHKWVADKSRDTARVFATYECPGMTYPQGASQQNEYLVWDDYQTEGYFEPGTYYWKETVDVISNIDKSDVLETFSVELGLEIDRLN